MKKMFLSFVAFAIIAPAVTAQQKKGHGTQTQARTRTQTPTPFEGTIDFIQSNGIDTSHYKYYVKGNNVKVDNYDARTKNIEGSFLIDLGTKKLTVLSPVRKIYFDQDPSAPAKPGGKPEVAKTGKVKKIDGYTCKEYVVVDAGEGLKINFWMAYGHFDFFDDMLRILNRKDKFSEYYLEIPDTKGMFPLLAIEEDLAGNKKGEMKALKITKTSVGPDTFMVPPGYKKFKK